MELCAALAAVAVVVGSDVAELAAAPPVAVVAVCVTGGVSKSAAFAAAGVVPAEVSPVAAVASPLVVGRFGVWPAAAIFAEIAPVVMVAVAGAVVPAAVSVPVVTCAAAAAPVD
jgi:hypothetical protein